MNYDVWLMLLGFNVDYWEQKDIEKAISDFGKLLVWEEDPIHLARIIVKARVVDLTEIPWFLVCSEGEDFEGDSWTAQCEILQVRQLGGGPLGEDEPPNRPNGVQPTMFEFFGFGQPGQGPNQEGGNPPDNPQANLDLNEALADQPLEGENAQGWGLWPNQDNKPVQVQNVNQLNAPVIPQDQPGNDFIEMNDLQQEPELDLNAPLEDDLGGIEDLLVIAENMDDQPFVGPQMENVIDEDAPSEAGSEDNMQVMEENVHVEVFIPLEQINPDEIHPDELMEFPEEEDHVNQIQLGFVQLIEPSINPIFRHLQPQFKPNAEATRLWANFFTSGKAHSSALVPQLWTDFFTALLSNPSSFTWAKKFLSSQALSHMGDLSSGLEFSLPDKYPITNVPLCHKSLPDVETSALPPGVSEIDE